MKRIQWGLVASLIAGLFATPALADDQQHQQPSQQGKPSQQQKPASEQAIQGSADMTEVGLGQTPAAVRSAIEKWAQGSAIKKVEEVRQGTKLQYRAEIERKGKNLQVLVDEKGEVLRAGSDVGVSKKIF